MTANEAAAGAAESLRGWFAGRLPDDWFEEPPEIVVDREEISIIGRLASPAAPGGSTGAGEPAAAAASEATAAAGGEGGGQGGGEGDGEAAGPASRDPGASEAAGAAAAMGRARRFREDTRDARIEIAREAEHLFGRKVSWGVLCAEHKVMFTTLSVPVMTRLRQPERRVLDTLVDAGVARSRSDALAWCVRLVGQHEDSWLAELRDALRRVEEVRASGPRA